MTDTCSPRSPSFPRGSGPESCFLYRFLPSPHLLWSCLLLRALLTLCSQLVFPTDKLEPLRVIMRGGLSRKHLPTPEWESGFSREKDKDTSQELVETNGTCTARQIWGEGSPTVIAPDPWVAVASAYGFSISQADDKRTSWPIKRAPRVSPDSMESLPEAFPCPINSTKCVKM